jgi:hypothetical protein
MSSQIIQIDGLLALYGPETKQARIEAHQFVKDAMDRIWPDERSRSFELRPVTGAQTFYEQLELLQPKNDSQATAKAQLMSLTLTLKDSYWLMYLQTEQTSISLPLLMVVTSWLVAIFVSFGIFAPRNPTVMVTLIVCALAVSAAIFIIMSMYSPFSGILTISPAAVRDALAQMGR